MRGLTILSGLVIVAAPAVLEAQGGFRFPDNPKNLQVLPDSIRGPKLGQIMRGFTGALGVRCEHCHVGQGDLTTFDFASDEKPAKEKARLMLKMVMAINGTHLAGLGEKRMTVTCTTCHRGLTRPVMLEDVLEAAIDSAGIGAATTKYDELRKRYYGGFSYNFARGPLTILGERLMTKQKYAEAVAVLQLEIANNGEDVRTLMALGGAQVQAGDKEGAKKTFEKGLSLAPDNMKPMVQQQIDRMLKP
jgi:hypothetical protein